MFDYDDHGSNYVLFTLFAALLFPLTYFLWPSLSAQGDVEHHDSGRGSYKKIISKSIIKAAILLLLWSSFIYFAFTLSQIESMEYDPYKILQLDGDVTNSQIKQRYRELSKIHHPDRGGDPINFDKIAKAYKVLTDDEAKRNFVLHGNPDGPRAVSFGIALPSWIISQQYRSWVLACYIPVLLVIFLVLWWCVENEVNSTLDATKQRPRNKRRNRGVS